jgi:hypothetical protein
MKIAACCGLVLLGFVTAAAAAPDKAVRIELNGVEAAQNRCRLSFVIENKSTDAFESLKLDLVVFGKDGGIQRRLVTDMAPLRPSKTIVKAFDIDGDCAAIGSILVNDVTACAPGPATACLERLTLESRIQNVRLFK